MGTKMAVAFANIFTASIEMEILRQSVYKPLMWKRFFSDVFCLWDTNKEEIEHFIEQANLHYVTIKFTAEVLQSETTFLDTTVYQGERFEKESITSETEKDIVLKKADKGTTSILDVRTHYKPTAAGVKKGFVKGEALRLLRTNSSKVMFEENIKNFRIRLTSRGYPNNLMDKILPEVKFTERKNALTQKRKAHKKILPTL